MVSNVVKLSIYLALELIMDNYTSINLEDCFFPNII